MSVHDSNKLALGIKQLLEIIGEDPTRKELQKTPERFLKGMQYLLSGYKTDPSSIIDSTIDYTDDDMIMLKDISFTSVCEHHLLPFTGKIHIAYIPNNRIVGIGKITQIVDALTKRLQIQERLMKEIVETIQSSILKPRGVMIAIEAQHLCMQVSSNSQGATFSTSFCTKAFKENPKLKDEFFTRTKGC